MAAGLLVAAASANPTQEALAPLERAVAPLLEMSEYQLRALVPETGGLLFVPSPAAPQGSDRMGDWDYDFDKPFQIRCKISDEVFPNPAFAEDQVIGEAEGWAPDAVLYYKAPDSGRAYFVTEHIRYQRRAGLEGRIGMLARLYTATGREDYARVGAVLLDEFARKLPAWPHKYELPHQMPVFFPPVLSPQQRQSIHERTGPERLARWNWWMHGELPLPLLDFYAATRDWPGWQKTGGAKERIAADLFIPLGDSIVLAEELYTNISPPNWSGLLLGGALLGREDWIDEAARRLEHFLDTRFYHDGAWMESSISYSNQMLPALRNLETALRRAEDSAGGEPAEQKIRELRERVAGAVEWTLRTLREARLPDGKFIPLNDTWSWQSPREDLGPPPDRSSVFPGAGWIALRLGADAVLTLNATTGAYHKHRDALSILLHVDGVEWLSDIGYTHSDLRGWAAATTSHNTVVMDGRNSALDRKGDATWLTGWFFREGLPFAFASAQAKAAYPGGPARRTVCFLRGPEGEAHVVVDFFEINGGTVRDLVHLGPLVEEAFIEFHGKEWRTAGGILCDGLEERPPPPEFWTPGYSHARDSRLAETETPARIVWRADDERQMITEILAPKTLQRIASRVPSIRQVQDAGNHQSPRNELLFESLAPHLVLRDRTGPEPVRFVAAHVVADGNSTPEIGMTDENAPVRIRWENGETDEILVSQDPGSAGFPRVRWRRLDTAGNAIQSVAYRWDWIEEKPEEHQSDWVGTPIELDDAGGVITARNGRTAPPVTTLPGQPVFLRIGEDRWRPFEFVALEPGEEMVRAQTASQLGMVAVKGGYDITGPAPGFAPGEVLQLVVPNILVHGD